MERGVPVRVTGRPVGQDKPVNEYQPGQKTYRLSLWDREQISMEKAKGSGVRQIAARLGRPASTVSRELARGSITGEYRPVAAHRDALDRARRPRESKLARPGPLRDYVADQLERKRSPEQIAHRIRLDFPDDPEMRVCHETIYQAVYVQARGGLKREVETALRRGRAYRQPRKNGEQRRGRIPGMIPISQRPDEVDTRAVPGHWEGDLIIGKNSASAVVTLVERSSRVTLLGYLPGDHTAATVRDAIIPAIQTLPDTMRRSLTWDQGREMACHFQVADQAGIDVYVADPHSPWQRGTNENTNGLLRQYLPKGTDLSIHTPDDLHAIADELNNRPRKVLGWLTPLEAFHLLLGHEVTISGRPAHLPDSLLPLTQRCVDS
jgi:IS30 family transposase